MGEDAKIVWQTPMGDKATLEAGPEVKDYANFWKSVKIRKIDNKGGEHEFRKKRSWNTIVGFIGMKYHCPE